MGVRGTGRSGPSRPGSTPAGSGQVWVANGTYRERVTMRDGVALLGGFKGNELDAGMRNPMRNKAVITSANLSGVTSGTVVMDGITGARIEGFTITGAKVYGFGGGVFCTDADDSNEIVNCVITGNSAFYGTSAGVFCRNASPAIVNCVITSNKGGVNGGGIVCTTGSLPGIMSCTIRNNQTSGIVCGAGCTSTIVNTYHHRRNGRRDGGGGRRPTGSDP